ncbi:MAG: ABC transporter ATP-binding protein [Chloroflexi bacterium]|nr:ABC transporter ATP-binding protein [Chloroflexota bacterium]
MRFENSGSPENPATKNATAVEVCDLSHRYRVGDRTVTAIDGVNLLVDDGEFVAVVGPSGCGKTTLLRAVAGLLTPSSGRVRVLGKTSRSARQDRALGLVTQDPGLLPWLNVAANVQLTLDITGRGADADKRVSELLERVGIGQFAAYVPGQLSGGMRQRVALARALAHRPRLLLMDEPFGALDELSREEMRLELLRVWEDERTSVVFVTHSIREAVLLADRVVVMNGRPGRVTAEVTIDLERPRSALLEDKPHYQELVSRVRNLLFAEPVPSNASGQVALGD